MTLGTGIFLAAIVMSLTALFIATKDRWNWKKILLWPLGICVAGGLAMWGYIEYDNRAREALAIERAVQSSFWDIPLGATQDDVVFKKGKPTERETEVWTYSDEQDVYQVWFRQNHVRGIWFTGDSPIPKIEGLHGTIRKADSSADVVSAFGEPAFVENKDEGAFRIYCYPAYQTFFLLTKDQVTTLGIYDRKSPPSGCEPPAKAGAATK